MSAMNKLRVGTVITCTVCLHVYGITLLFSACRSIGYNYNELQLPLKPLYLNYDLGFFRHTLED